MVSFDSIFRSMLIKYIVEEEGALWTEGRISWLSINIGSSKDKRYSLLMVTFFLASVLVVYHQEGSIVGRVLGASRAYG